MGLLDPATSDGRVIFFLPWEGVVATIAASHVCHVISCVHVQVLQLPGQQILQLK